MKQQFVRLLSTLLLFAVLTGSVSQLVSYKTPVGKDYNSLDLSPTRRSLLAVPDERATTLVATLDGTINLVDPMSEKVLWSYATGAPIYSSYHTPVKHNTSVHGALYYVDCGDDWMLYAHTEVGKMVCL